MGLFVFKETQQKYKKLYKSLGLSTEKRVIMARFWMVKPPQYAIIYTLGKASLC